MAMKTLSLLLAAQLAPTLCFIPRRPMNYQQQTKLAAATKKGDVVTIDLSLETVGDFVAEPLFDTRGEVTFVLGEGNYLPGIHEILLENGGKEVGARVENKEIDAGWGEKNPNLIATASLAQAPAGAEMKVGMELYLQTGQTCRVTEVTDTTFTIDANPPLAGASYKCSFTLQNIQPKSDFEVATVALGCFWGGELAYMREPGIVGTKVGYTQGDTANPAYKEVCSGTTGHTEAIQIIFDPQIVSFERICKLGMERLGDSKYLLNQVGNDKGTQYRHGIYYHSDEQRKVAQKVLAAVPERNGVTVQTELKQASIFYDAEDYHQQYLLKGGQSAKKGATENIRCYG